MRVKLSGGTEITAVLPGQSGHAVGAPITLAFDPSNAHLFDADQRRVN
ncbi:TOBE domain-containing protein [Devosia sp. MC521]|nr:TOBE domain-containing protein [Devosia sp. MC521]QMW64649.1 TOBE domain-containing protein [Devosia sp. MC521]